MSRAPLNRPWRSQLEFYHVRRMHSVLCYTALGCQLYDVGTSQVPELCIVCVLVPIAHFRQSTSQDLQQAPLIQKDTLYALEERLSEGASIDALMRFNHNLRSLSSDDWQQRLLPVITELTYNLETFNPAFTHVMLKVQSSIGHSDYVRRDTALKNLIVPLAGEYGMHNGEPQAKTHRELFSDWIESMLGLTAADVVARGGDAPPAAVRLFEQMTRDIGSAGGAAEACPLEAACYALGYNLAIEFLADYEKRWMLESFRELDRSFMAAQGRDVDWTFLEVHAEDEMEHAALGHAAVVALVPEELKDTVQRAMDDHDRDFAAFYNALADKLAQERAA
eukprot:TRINITY_DN7888_c0_g1_i1.p1 TRINITY_DN7888_c0_g1~~TRINITY_DN7888_c0_g1_i1.p1  ORF type:complete len:336 (+),score=39.54 TRINITY_DN7888_c0_g1_i1:486-1493(+)